MSAVVFVGPSLGAEVARARLPNATVLPPACMGDVLTAVDRGATIIGIVDGLFDTVLSVWHKEVLFAITRGVRVLGASSMGALRAAELHAFGMEGVGAIFEAFASGRYEDDDEVAVAHTPAAEGYRSVSEAMVNLRAGLARAVERELLSPREHDALVRGAKALFYPERSWGAVRQIALAEGMPAARVEALIADVRREPVDVKRDDALRLLDRIAALAADEAPPPPASFELEPTVFWDRLKRTFREGIRRPDGAGAPDADPASDDEILRHASLRGGRALFREALTAELVEREAARTKIAIDGATWRAAATRFRRDRGLLSAADLARWMSRHALGEEDFARLVRREALFDVVAARYAGEIRARALDVLKQRGELGRIRDDLRRRARYLRDGGASSPLSEAELVAWFTKNAGPFETTAPLWEHLGFEDAEAFRQELVILHALEREGA